MPNEHNKILKYNLGEKSMKAPFIIYADLERLFEKMNTCHDSPEKSSIHYLNIVHLMKQKIRLVII